MMEDEPIASVSSDASGSVGLKGRPSEDESSLTDGGDKLKSKVTPIRPSIPLDTLHTRVEPSQVVEYEWPLKSGDRYFIQEQIADLLDVKSFKRKYPDMGRKVELEEKEFLIRVHKINTVIPEYHMGGLTALRSIEVHELMSSEYPQIYSEYQKASADRIKRDMAERQKEIDAIKSDEKKMNELRKNAMKSAAEFNLELNSIKKLERRHFWDLQTSIVQSPLNRWRRLPASATRVSPYPVALIPGQFQEYYRRYTPRDMRKLPLNTALDSEELFLPRRDPSPPPICISERDMQVPHAIVVSGEIPVPKSPATPSTPASSAPPKEKRPPDLCSLCSKTNKHAPLLRCASCAVRVHPECIDMPDRMVDVVKAYAWNCIECKKCTVCEKPDNEEMMLFCDRCDRGYHTFCVGLDAPPTGAWVCENFCQPKDNSKVVMTRGGRASRRPVY